MNLQVKDSGLILAEVERTSTTVPTKWHILERSGEEVKQLTSKPIEGSIRARNVLSDKLGIPLEDLRFDDIATGFDLVRFAVFIDPKVYCNRCGHRHNLSKNGAHIEEKHPGWKETLQFKSSPRGQDIKQRAAERRERRAAKRRS